MNLEILRSVGFWIAIVAVLFGSLTVGGHVIGSSFLATIVGDLISLAGVAVGHSVTANSVRITS